jgi:hypothetical protein
MIVVMVFVIAIFILIKVYDLPALSVFGIINKAKAYMQLFKSRAP